MAEFYYWFKAIHVIAVISWMAGMLYLPRLFVYHCDIKVESNSYDLFVLMEKRLIRYIINPAMIVSVLFGLLNAHIYGFIALGTWFYIKMVCVFFLLLLHGLFIKWHKYFHNKTNPHSPTFFRIINESVTFCMILAVVMVIVKPFD